MEKEMILLYNIKDEEEKQIETIFKNLNINIELKKAEIEQDIISELCFITFIRLPEDVEQTRCIKELIKTLRGWQLFFIVDDNFFLNTKKLEENIKEYYQDYKNMKKYDTFNNVKDGIIGFAVGDALGVPSEFKSREEMNRNPITDMIGYGTYNLPEGTWSDDTSMTLATMDSLIDMGKIDINDMANKFIDWYRKNKYTATGKIFDIGETTKYALAKYELGLEKAENCGQTGEMDNGNGSLMRMLPIAYFIYLTQHYNLEDENTKLTNKKIYDIVKKVSMITHANEISILGCYIFVRFAIEIIEGKLKDLSYEYIKKLDYSFFRQETINKYHRILKGNIKHQSIDTIKSTGYIVDTLEAVFWLFLNSTDYNSTILKAINLGGDTDTISAITGGLLGVHYGIEKINDKWKEKLKRYEYINNLCDEFYDTYEVDLDWIFYLMDSREELKEALNNEK